MVDTIDTAGPVELLIFVGDRVGSVGRDTELLGELLTESASP